MQFEAREAFDLANESTIHASTLRRRRVRQRLPDRPAAGRARRARRPGLLRQTTSPGTTTKTSTATATTPRRATGRSPRLLKDLKARGLLDDTLVIWGGEFGRTPYSEGAKGRDHHSLGFSMWLAGGGVKGGYVHGATDELGMQAVDNRMHVHDLHATILHLMGLDHERLTYRYSGRDFRLTDVSGQRRPRDPRLIESVERAAWSDIPASSAAAPINFNEPV